MTSRLVVAGKGVKGERSESRVTGAQRRPLTPGPETTLLDQPGEAENPTTQRKKLIMRVDLPGVPVRVLYNVVESMELLSLSRTQIYELIRSGRLMTVTQGRRRLVPASAIEEYVALLLRESRGDAA